MKKIIPIKTICIVLIISSFFYFEKGFQSKKPEKVGSAKAAMGKLVISP